MKCSVGEKDYIGTGRQAKGRYGAADKAVEIAKDNAAKIAIQDLTKDRPELVIPDYGGRNRKS